MPPPPTAITESFGLFPFGEIRLQLWAYLAAIRGGPENNPKKHEGVPLHVNVCCVFWPDFGCCPQLKAGQKTFFAIFNLISYNASDQGKDLHRSLLNHPLC